MATFTGYGLSFRYPEEWELIENEGEDGTVMLHAQSASTAYWSLTLLPGREPFREVLAAVSESLQSEYDEVELHWGEAATVAGETSQTATFEFVCHELPVIAEAVVFDTGGRTALVLAQYADAESEEYETLLERMTASLRPAQQSAANA